MQNQQPIKEWVTPHELAPPPQYAARELWPNAIEGVIRAEHITLGVGIRIESGVEIVADRVVIGDHVYIGRNTRIITPHFEVGDYTRINEGSFCGGSKPMTIGANCYFGRNVQLDSRGGLTIGNNVGVGSLSQVWSHIKHGDTVQGNRWDKEYPVLIEDDVWLVARVTVGGCQHIGARSMVLNESNVTRDIPADSLYKGNPAVDVTDKYGAQFETLSTDEKLRRMYEQIAWFERDHPEHVNRLWAFSRLPEDIEGGAYDPYLTYFGVEDRRYTKRYTRAEVAFLKWTTAKFMPMETRTG